MRQRDLDTANRFGILEKVEAFEKELLKIDHVVDVEFDLDCYGDLHQIIFLPKYDIPVSLPNYYDVRKQMLLDVLAVAKIFGLTPSGDRIEDYGEHFYIVRDCDDSWGLGVQKSVNELLRDAYNRRWDVTLEQEAMAFAFRSEHPSLTLESSGWSGCSVVFKAVNDNEMRIVFLDILPEYYCGYEYIGALSSEERQMAYDELEALGCDIRNYCIVSVDMYGGRRFDENGKILPALLYEGLKYKRLEAKATVTLDANSKERGMEAEI